ncbi:hypothetical protein BP5796_10051 [Coleophoma crateriformis]|uniref:Uncharacterized protein n=1 Tax=Coleophoma crateriformis TaxID=565419 RepID=A0A3D8QU83_9HELO|nr:hypothetical protein BP5796_10051 [Coleophoma crateriformis]
MPNYIIQMSGAPGSGKSTLSQKLRHIIGGVIINHDLLKSFFLDNDIPFEQSARLTYLFQWILAEDLIKQGHTHIIIDSTCNHKETLDQGTALAQKYSYSYRYIECRVDDIDLLEKRLYNRVSMRSQRSSVNQPPIDAASDASYFEDYHTLFQRWINNPCRPASDAIIVDSTGSLEDCLDYVLKRITTSSSGQPRQAPISRSHATDDL